MGDDSMMPHVLGILGWAAGLVVLPAVVGGAVPAGVHSSHVAAVQHAPEAPARGEEVRVTLQLAPATDPEEVALTYCRAERYACAPSRLMAHLENGTFAATIVWDGRFFEGARNVGYKFTIRFANGSEEHSPREHWPARPAVLPEGAGIYYWYELPAASGGAVPGAGAFGVLLLLLAVGLQRRLRGRRPQRAAG